MTKELFANLSGGTAAAKPEKEKVDAKTPSAAEAAGEQEVVDAPEYTDEGDTVEKEPTELEILRQRANLMKLPYNDDTTVDELKAAIQLKLNPPEQEETPKQKVAATKSEASAAAQPPAGTPEDEIEYEPAVTQKAAKVVSKPKTLRAAVIAENMRLVRLRITNLDPKDKDLSGQIFTVSNEFLGTVSKFIPFGEATENGYHVPYCLYKFLRDMKFLQIRVTKPNGKEKVETGWVRKFALEELPPLTDEELDRLKTAQLASGAIDN